MAEKHRSSVRETLLREARRVVIKLGTSTVTGLNGDFCVERVEPIARSIAGLMKDGRQVILVSSGAVGLGRSWLGLHQARLHDLVTKQACAAVGQSLLMNAYKELFSALDLKVAQVLLTEDDFTVWQRYSNFKGAVEKLLQFHVLPIINENDTVSTVELAPVGNSSRRAFSDNDRLAALVMSGLEADALVLLTNVGGLLDGPASANFADGAGDGVIPIVERITPELAALAAGPSATGRGGMVTKLEAARIAMHCGGAAVIADGRAPGVLDRVFAGEPVGTAFLPFSRMKGKRRWIAFAAGVRGRIVVDEGARRALTDGKASLLTSGVTRVDSHFAPKDVIGIADRAGREFARGIAECNSHQAEQVLGKASRARGAAASRVVVRRDNIVLIEP